MTLRVRFFLVVGLIVFIHQWAKAQLNSDVQYLSKVGILDSIYSDVLQESRDIYIQLPASFSPEKHQQYPVAFILDGEVFLPTVSNVHDYYAGGFMPEMVLVGISNSENRVRDLTTSTITTKYGMPFTEKNGEADTFLQFIEKELIPFVENKYPVTRFRTLIGHSYGGLFTIYTLINHPHLFANYLAIDPSLDWDDQKLLQETQGLSDTPQYANKSLFISLSGQLHMQNPQVTIDNVMQDTTEFTLFARSNIAFSDMLRQQALNSLSFDWKFYPNDLHGTIPYPSIMDGLVSLFTWYQMENTDKFNNPTTPKEELSGIIKYRAEKLEDHFGYPVPPYPEDLLTILGYMSVDMEQAEKAKLFFEFVMEYYPNSANAYDAMSEYYEGIGDDANALKFATKAYELNDDDYHKQRMETLKKK